MKQDAGCCAILVFTHNGRKDVEGKLLELVAAASRRSAPARSSINSIDRDGMMKGYDLELATAVRAVNVPCRSRCSAAPARSRHAQN